MPVSEYQRDGLSAGDFRKLRDLIYRECGIDLAPEKLTMLEGRLRRRLRSLRLDSCSAYCDYLFRDGRSVDEMAHLIDAVTTNKTDFFRESHHCDYLTGTAVPDLRRMGSAPPFGKPLLVWSAGCSTGEEPYTLGVVLSEYAETVPGFRFRILATDISTEVLEKAHRGVYTAESVEAVPPLLRRKYMMRSKNQANRLFRIVPEVRELIEFRRLNLMDSDFGIAEQMDVIFCRNVLIYFDRATRAALIERFRRQLRPGGYLFLGHSETLHGCDARLAAAGPTVYRRPDERAGL